MKFIKFAEAKKASKKLLRPVRPDNIATKQVAKSMVMGAGRKGILWQEQGKTIEEIKQKMETFGEKLKVKKQVIAAKNQIYIANKKIDKTVQAPTNVISPPKTNAEVFLKDNPNTFKDTYTPKAGNLSKTVDKIISPKSSGKNLLIGAGVTTGAVVLGGLGYGLALRKMRSDKGKKRGSYKNFNFLGQLIKF